MVSRPTDGVEAVLHRVRTPGTPGKTRLARSGASSAKKEERGSRSSAKDVSELKDYVRRPYVLKRKRRDNELTNRFAKSNWGIVWGKAPSVPSTEL
jgi:hypothetical protein